MKQKKQKYFTDFEPFVKWFRNLENKKRQTFRKQVMKEMFPDKSRSAWYNLLYGKTPLTYLLGKQLLLIAMQEDNKITSSELFPTLKIEIEMNNKLAYYLSLRNMTQKKLSEITQIREQSISGYVGCRNEPGVTNAQLIANALNVDVKVLFPIPSKE